jgi:hypothetical protein
MLPDSPSLDYLRRQPKDMLVGMRETRPSASLADAQAALARKYGFRTWPELTPGDDIAPWIIFVLLIGESKPR